MDIKYLIDKWGKEFQNELWDELPYSEYANLSSMILYAVIRENKFKNIFEMGCERQSRSSYIIQKALLKNDDDFTHYMSDFPIILEQAIENLFNKVGVSAVAGDVTEVNFDYKDIDFLFIDAHHEKWFASWYLDSIIPQLKKGTYIHVHDIYLYQDWQHRFPEVICETQEFQERNKQGNLSLDKLFWMEDLAMHDKDIWDYIQKKFNFIGNFPAPSLPYGDGTTYWIKK